MSHDLMYELTDGDGGGRTQAILLRLSTHVEVIVPDPLRHERAVVRVELFDGRLQALAWDARTVAADGEPVVVPLLSSPDTEVAHG